MSEFLGEYLQIGLSDIVIIDHTWHENAGGYQNEQTTETIVARKGDGYVRIGVYLSSVFGWKPRRSFDVTSQEKITRQSYLALSRGKEIIDTPEAREQIKKEAEFRREMSKLSNDIQQLAPQCPECHSQMTARSGKYGPFWGCSRFPKCSATQKMSPDARKLYDRWYKGDV